MKLTCIAKIEQKWQEKTTKSLVGAGEEAPNQMLTSISVASHPFTLAIVPFTLSSFLLFHWIKTAWKILASTILRNRKIFQTSYLKNHLETFGIVAKWIYENSKKGSNVFIVVCKVKLTLVYTLFVYLCLIRIVCGTIKLQFHFT